MPMPSVPGMGVPWLHPKPCCKWSSSALVGIINGRVRGSQGKGKDIKLEIKWFCSVMSPEAPYFAACCSWSPTSAAALGAVGGAGWGGAAGVWPGRMPTGGLALRGEAEALGAFPRYCLVLTSPGQPLGARGVRFAGGKAGSWQCPAPPVPRSHSCGRGGFRGGETHARTHLRRPPDGSCSASDPKALRDPSFLTWPIWQGGEGIPSGGACALSRGPWHRRSLPPQRDPRPPPLPALPSQPCQIPLLPSGELSLLCLLL